MPIQMFWQMGERGEATRYVRQGSNLREFQSIGDAAYEDISEYLASKVVQMNQANRNKLNRLIDKAVNAELQVMRRVMTTNIMGKVSDPWKGASFGDREMMLHFEHRQVKGKLADQHPLVGGQIDWHKLSKRTRKEKWEKYGQRLSQTKHFIGSRELVNYLRSNLLDILSASSGGVKTKVTNNWRLKRGQKLQKGTEVIAFITIKMFPKLNAAHLPYLGGGEWFDTTNDGALENRLFRKKSIAQKLAGQPEWHRPMLQPILQFWMDYRLPRAILSAIRTFKPVGEEVVHRVESNLGRGKIFSAAKAMKGKWR